MKSWILPVLSVLFPAWCGGGGGDDTGGTEPSVDPSLSVPTLSVASPERGLMTTASIATVTGQASSDAGGLSVMVADQLVALGSDGSFAAEVELDRGTTIIETTAADADFAEATDTRAVISGEYWPMDEPLDVGMAFMISEAAFGEMASMANHYFEPSDIDDIVDNPVLHMEDEYCMGWCYTLWGIEMSVFDAGFSDISALVVPGEDELTISFTMQDFTMDWIGTGVISEVGCSGGGSMYARSMVVDMSLELEWIDGRALASVTDIDVRSEGFECEFDNFMYQAAGYFGFDLDTFVVGMAESVFAEMLEQKTPGLIRDLVDKANLSKQIDVSGQGYLFVAQVIGLELLPEGLTIRHQTSFCPPERTHEDPGPGSLYSAAALPAMPESDQMAAVMSLNLLNQMFHSAWDGGALDMTLPAESMGIKVADFEAFVPGVQELTVTTQAMLPPTVTPSVSGDHGGLFTLGDLLFSISDPSVSPDPLVEMALSLRGDLDLAVSGETLVLALYTMDVHPSVRSPQELTVGEHSGLIAMLEPIAEAELPGMLSGMLALPLDIIDDYTMQDVSSQPGDEQILVFGTVVQQ